MNLVLQRDPTEKETTFGQWFIDDVFECYTLEDAIRDQKIENRTCIPPGRYRMTLETSHRFGPETLTLNAVPGFTDIRVHGGNNAGDTKGCLLVGDLINRNSEPPTISGAILRGVLKRLKYKIIAGLNDGDVWIEVKNPKEPK